MIKLENDNGNEEGDADEEGVEEEVDYGNDDERERKTGK